jgi:hypothetical protein
MSPELERILSQAQQLDRQSQIQLISHLSNQTQPETKDPTENPWLAIAGSLVDDPLFEEYVAEIDRYRQEIDLLEQSINGYILLESSSAIDFLQEHQELFVLLKEASKEIRKYFPSEDLKLELVSDPEIVQDRQLFVYIFTSLSVTDALNKFDEFDEQWWLDRIDRANGLLNFNLRFV